MAASSGVSARQLLERDKSSGYRPILTFLEPLDNKLGGGIQPGLITEFVGDRSLGKTGFCLQLCLDVQLPVELNGLAGEAFYIDTKNCFPSRRLKTMAEAFVTHCNGVLQEQRLSVNGVMDGVGLVKALSLTKLIRVLITLDDHIAQNRKIRLLVLDSIAMPFFFEDEENFNERNRTIYRIGELLHYLVEKYGVAVVVTNNLTTRFQNGEGMSVPCLGDSWFHIPNQRIHLYWDKTGERVAEVVKLKSSSAASVSGGVKYKITEDGIRSRN